MLNIFPFKQSDGSRCGPASIKMVLQYYGIDALEEEISQRCSLTYELGCTDFQMKKAIESYGLSCQIINNSSLEEIEYWLKHHMPVIVDWFTPGISPQRGDMPNGHSSVVVGIDRDAITLIDPEDGSIRSIQRDEFLRVWFDWREYPKITTWEDMVIRQLIVVFPSKLSYQGG